MNASKIIIIVFVIVAVLWAATFIAMRMLFKEISSTGQPAATMETGQTVEEPSLNYAIPENTVPTIQEIEANIKKAEEKRQIAEEVRVQIEREKVVKGAERAVLQEEPAKEATKIEGSAAKPVSSVPPTRKEIIFPSREERERMRSRGVITY